MKLQRVKLKMGKSNLFIGDSFLKDLSTHISALNISANKVFILTDSTARKFVIPVLKKFLPSILDKNIIAIKSGEQYKKMDTCKLVWNKLTQLGADRYSLLINLGGGTISDLGGFVASTYMRGIKYINIPTTLLAMVDASVGGKVGVDLNGLKNHIGLFSDPEAVFVCPVFLNTLSKRLLLCGYAEILKHALIVDADYWKVLSKAHAKTKQEWYSLIKRSIEIKKKITEDDPLEKGERRLLNFGHTTAHALEAYSVKKGGSKIMHGEAVAWGIIVESYLSFKYKKLPHERLQEISSFIKKLYKIKIPSISFPVLIAIMKKDKKNKGDKINFTLISEIGKAHIDNYCEKGDIKKAIDYANSQF